MVNDLSILKTSSSTPLTGSRRRSRATHRRRYRRSSRRSGWAGEPIEHAIAIMMEAHWRSAVHPDRAEGIGAFNEDHEPTFADPDH
jgi:hypothetical protein